jgi:signal transduction histidine kinase
MSRNFRRTRHWLVIDVSLAVGFAGLDTVLTLTGGSWWPAHPSTLAWSMLGLQAVADLTLVARRRFPLTVIAILAAYTLAISLLISPAGLLTPVHAANVWAPAGTLLAAYGPFYYPKDRRVAFAAFGTLTLIVCRVWEPSATVITIGVLRTAVGPLLGLYLGARQAMVRALRDRAERAERESALLAEQARTQERARLAGEMHDVVTHRLSLMVLQAGALGVSARDDATRRAAEELRAAGCQALDELRDLVGILRTMPDDGDNLSLAGIAALVAESNAVGIPAELIEEGDPALASPVVGRTAYRVVREALTNVRKHAPGARVVIQLRYAGSEVAVSVRNTPVPASASALAATGSGLGIASLRQRIELMHGSLRAGREADGGYCLEASMPSYVPTAEPAGRA